MNSRYFIKLDAVDNEYSLDESPWESQCWEQILDEYGFLMEDSYNSELIDIERLKNLPGAIIVAEAGMGKSYIAKEIMNSIPEDECMYIEPCLYTSNPQAFETEFTQSNWQYLLVDGLDENPNIVSILIRKLSSHVNGKHVFLTSRSIQQLKPLQKRLDLPVYILLPFSENNVRQIAQNEEIDGNQFLSSVKQKNLSYICSNPLGCRHLMKIFKKGTLANITNEQLWVTAILELCSENKSETCDLKMKENIVTKQKCYDMAAKIAIVLKLTGDSIIQRISETETDGDSVDFSRFFERNEWPIFNSILHRAIFTPVDNDISRFSHKSYYDYFASIGLQKYVPERTWMSIVCSPNREAIYPQWEDVVAWLATQNKTWLNYLLEKQPELLLLSDSLINSVGIATLCKSLLKRSKDLDYWNLNKVTFLQRLHCLKSSDIDSYLHSSLGKMNDNSEREMAINIIRKCQLQSLEKELVDIFCDSSENHFMRINAGYTLNEIASEDARKMCKHILTDKMCSTDFKGILFQMTWPHYISIQEIWPHIRNYDNNNMDSLWTWIKVDFPRSLIELSENIVFETLQFLIDNVEIDSTPGGISDMLRQILTLCWKKFDSYDRSVIICKGILRFIESNLYPFYKNTLSAVPEEICCSPVEFKSAVEQRHRLAVKLIGLSDVHGKELTNYSCPIVDSDDISFLFGQIQSSTNSFLQRKWCKCLNSIQGSVSFPEYKDNWDKVHELFPDILQYDAEKTVIEREKIKQEWEKQNENWRLLHEENESKKQEDISSRINLVRHFISEKKVQKCFSFIANTIILTSPSHSFDFSSSTAWIHLTASEREQLICGTRDYLQNEAPIPVEDHKLYFTSTLALHLLVSSAPDCFRRLPDSIIEKHSGDLFSCLELEYHNRQHELSLLLEMMVTFFPQAFIKNLFKWLDNSMREGCFPSLITIKKVLSSEILDKIIEHIEHIDISDRMEFKALTEIKKYTKDKVEAYIGRKLTLLPNDLSCWGHRFSIFVMDFIPEKIIDFVQEVQTNPSWGKEWFEDIICVDDSTYPLLPVFSKAPIETLADLYIWLHQNYPTENEPQHNGGFTPNAYDLIYPFINSIFNSIVSYSSGNVEPTLRRIAEVFPCDSELNDFIKRAKRKYLSQNAVIYSENEILQLLTNNHAVVINSPEDLLSLTIKAIENYQTYLMGTITPRVEDLWNNIGDSDIKPKHEENFSDHLKSFLDQYFRNEAIIINREVQLNRGRNGEAGSRTDIWIDTFTHCPKQKLSLCIEVKGSWNSSAITAMNDQLIAKYMDNDGADAGILLIGWFQSKKCHQQDNIWNDDREKAREEIMKQEQQARNNGKIIKGIVIDCDYRI